MMKPMSVITFLAALSIAAPIAADAQVLSGPGISPDVAVKMKARQDKLDLASKFSKIGRDYLDKKQYASAEIAFRTAIKIEDDEDTSNNVQLAHTLVLQGKPQEALTIYRKVLYEPLSDAWTIVPGEVYAPYGVLSSSGESESLHACMEYAILASKIGSWPEAAYIFRNTLASMPEDRVMPKIDVQFDANEPEPEKLQAAAHIASGIGYISNADPKNAMPEFEQAHTLEPDWPLATVYYAYGLQRAVGRTSKTKAMYRDAADTGTGDVKAFAERYLQMYP